MQSDWFQDDIGIHRGSSTHVEVVCSTTVLLVLNWDSDVSGVPIVKYVGIRRNPKSSLELNGLFLSRSGLPILIEVPYNAESASLSDLSKTLQVGE